MDYESGKTVEFLKAVRHAEIMVECLTSSFAQSLKADSWESKCSISTANDENGVQSLLTPAVSVQARGYAVFRLEVSLGFLISIQAHNDHWVISSNAQLSSNDLFLDDLDLFGWASEVRRTASLTELTRLIYVVSEELRTLATSTDWKSKLSGVEDYISSGSVKNSPICPTPEKYG